LHLMCLDISSTSRAEGEFSALHLLKLSAGMGFVRALQKIKWQSERRYNRKMFLSQRNMNTVIKRKSEHCPSMEEWRALDKKITPHYLSMIENQMERAQAYSYQVVEVEKQGDTVTAVVVAVFVRRDEDGDDAQVLSEDDGEGNADENAEADEEDEEREGAEEHEQQHEGAPELVDDDDAADLEVNPDHAASVPVYVSVITDADDWTPFLYRRVRKVKITVTSPSTVELCCDCGHMARSAYVCGHVLCLKKAIHVQDFDILNPEQKLHPRLLKSLYWGVHHSKKRVDHEDDIPLPKANREAFMQWFDTQPPPSYMGVPEVGQIGRLRNDDGDDGDTGGDNAGGADVADHSRIRRSKTRIQKLHNHTLSRLQENHYEIMDFCKVDREAAVTFLQNQDEFLNEWRNRKRMRQPGRKKVDRPRGVADRDKGASAGAYRPTKRKKVAEDADPVLTLREHIRKHGLPNGSYVQIENRKNEKWFMRIVKGHVIDANSDDPKLASALWCEPNNVRKLSKEYSAPQLCEIKTITDAGTKDKFKRMLKKK